MLVIDCHGHFTSEPPQVGEFRRRQLAALEAGQPAPDPPEVTDGELVESIGANQLRVMDERGIDVVLFSPRASAMGHHVQDVEAGRVWTSFSNDLVRRVSDLFPDRFAPVCQLPQTPGGDLAPSLEELRRCVDAGFVAANVSPDPSGGNWTGRPVTDPYWYPLFEVMEDLDVPAMIHVSGSCNPNFHTLGAHYLNADTTVFMQLVEGDLFGRFPRLRLVIPHGGGAVPYHWGRYKGLAARFDRPPIEPHLMGNLYFDTCVYHRPGVQLLLDVVDPANVLFGSEMLGAVRGVNPDSGSGWDDTRRYVDSLNLGEDVRRAVYEGNVRRVYPRLDLRLQAQGR
ncbi:MAG: amidohydrolase [Acidobacteriota bacterium]|nr:amidohydrolase [Acidobacteriota bacterium]